MAPMGGSCGDETPPLVACDTAQGQGCLGGQCGASETCDPRSFSARCDGDNLVFCYSSGRVWHRDCRRDHQSGGTRPATCAGAGATAQCVSEAGGSCDWQNGGLECAAGLTCNSGVCG